MKNNIKRLKLSWIISITVLIFSLILTGVSFAWLTDKVTTSDKTLYFGEIKLDTSGGATTTSMTLKANNTEVTDSAALMPGDEVDLTIKVKLTDGSQPAYYLVYLGHDGLFDNEKQFFFLQDNVVYATDGTTTNKINSDGSEDTSTTIEHIVGSIDKNTTHTINLTQTIGLDKTKDDLQGSKTISCTICAIQQANLKEAEAYKELIKEFPVTFSSSWKSAITNHKTITSLGFYKTAPAGLTLNSELTSAYNNLSDISKTDKDKIQVYSNGTTNTKIAFVSDAKILAPSNCDSMFNNCQALTSLDLRSFDTSNVTNMSSMFSWCKALASLDLSSFDTSNVTKMRSMFIACHALTNLDLSGFNTSNVTDMAYMFYNCIALTSLNVSSFDTSNVTGMGYMFYECEALKSLDLSNFNTSNVTSMNYIFYNCIALTRLDLSSFDTSNGGWHGIFVGTFSNNPSGSTLYISSKFTNQGTAFTKDTLVSATSLSSSVTVIRDGVTLS